MIKGKKGKGDQLSKESNQPTVIFNDRYNHERESKIKNGGKETVQPEKNINIQESDTRSIQRQSKSKIIILQELLSLGVDRSRFEHSLLALVQSHLKLRSFLPGWKFQHPSPLIIVDQCHQRCGVSFIQHDHTRAVLHIRSESRRSIAIVLVEPELQLV